MILSSDLTLHGEKFEGERTCIQRGHIEREEEQDLQKELPQLL